MENHNPDNGTRPTIMECQTNHNGTANISQWNGITLMEYFK